MKIIKTNITTHKSVTLAECDTIASAEALRKEAIKALYRTQTYDNYIIEIID